MLEALDGYPRAAHEIYHVHGAMPPPVSERVAGKDSWRTLYYRSKQQSVRGAAFRGPLIRHRIIADRVPAVSPSSPRTVDAQKSM